MKKIKIIEGWSAEALEQKTNEALASIKAESVDIKYMLPEHKIVIEYDERIVELKCMDCQFYDKNGDGRGAFGCCQRKGVRVRFSQKACDRFEDVRGVSE